MTGADNIFNGIYGKADYPVIIYSFSGEVEWRNHAAEKITADELHSVFTEISGESGNIRFGNGGKYRLIEVSGAEYIAAELFRDNAVARILADTRSAGFLHYSDMTVRQAVTGISASCEIINSISEINGSDEAEQCLDNIMKSCCRLMRNAQLSSQLAAAADRENLCPVLIDLDMFLSGLAEGCRNALGGQNTVIYTGDCGCIVSADKNLLTYFMLSIIRQLASRGAESRSIKITAVKNGNNAEISFSGDGIQLDSDSPSTVFDELTREVNGIFAENLDAVCSFSGNSLNIFMKCAENNGMAVMETDKIFFNDSLFSPYNIMLNNLTDFRAFY